MTTILEKKTGKKSLFMISIDLTKAYDCLEWSFIRHCLHHFKLPASLIKLILSCISTPQSVVLINGRKSDPIMPTRGLRQGDPMSPYIFIMCLEYLSFLISKAVEAKFWVPIKIHGGDISFSHIFYADDLLLFGVNIPSTITAVNSIMALFSKLSGLQMNLNKSKIIFSTNSSVQQKFAACTALHIPEAASLGKHLGFPITKGAPKKEHFLHIIDSMKAKLSAWKATLLTPAGRIILIKSTLQSIPAYPMQMTTLPASICKQVDKICRDFLWAKNSNQNGLHLVNWTKCCLPKEHGGLGLRKAVHMNKALQMKIGWRFLKEIDKPWQQLLSHKYKRIGSTVIP